MVSASGLWTQTARIWDAASGGRAGHLLGQNGRSPGCARSARTGPSWPRAGAGGHPQDLGGGQLGPSGPPFGTHRVPWSPARSAQTPGSFVRRPMAWTTPSTVWDVATGTERATLSGPCRARLRLSPSAPMPPYVGVGRARTTPSRSGRWQRGPRGPASLFRVNLAASASIRPAVCRLRGFLVAPCASRTWWTHYGPLTVTAADRGEGPAVRCPACRGDIPLDRDGLGSVTPCPGCETPLRVNPFVLRPWRKEGRRFPRLTWRRDGRR